MKIESKRQQTGYNKLKIANQSQNKLKIATKIKKNVFKKNTID